LLTTRDFRDSYTYSNRLELAHKMVKLMKEVEFKIPLEISLDFTSNICTLTYNGSGFSYQDLKNSSYTSLTGGYGKLIILNCSGINYISDDTWIVPIKYKITTIKQILYTPNQVEKWLLTLYNTTNLGELENSDVLQEIIFNESLSRPIKFKKELQMSFTRLENSNKFLQVPPGTLNGSDLSHIKQIALDNNYTEIFITWRQSSSYEMLFSCEKEFEALGIILHV